MKKIDLQKIKNTKKDTKVPYTITGNGVGHKEASDIIKSSKIKKQLNNIKLLKI